MNKVATAGIAIFLLLFTVVAAAPTNVITYVKGTCAQNASCEGWAYDKATQTTLKDHQTDIASVVDTYGGYSVYRCTLPLEDAAFEGMYVVINVTNTACSPSVYTGYTIAQTLYTPVEQRLVNTTSSLTLLQPSNGVVTSDNTTTFTWSNDVSGATYALLVATDSGFSSIVRNITGIAITNHTLSTPLDDNIYYWKIQLFEGTKMKQESMTRSLTIQTTGPQIISSYPLTGSYTLANPTVEINTSTSATCKYSYSPGTSFGSKTVFDTTGGTIHTESLTLPNEGSNTLYIECDDGAYSSGDISYVLVRDTTGPSSSSATVTLHGGLAHTESTTLNISWTGFLDAGVGLIDGYYYDFTDQSPAQIATYNVTSPAQLTVSSEGTYRAYVWARDSLGNIGFSKQSPPIVVDYTEPIIGTPSTTPSTITRYHTGTVSVLVTVTDTSALMGGKPKIRYTLASNPEQGPYNMTIVGGNYYSYTIPQPTGGWIGVAGKNLTLVINATDIYGHTFERTRTLTIVNQTSPPSFNSITAKVVDEDSLLEFIISGTDPDNDVLTFTTNVSGINVTQINETHSRVSWFPDNDDVGVHTVNFSVGDGGYLVSQLVSIIVQNTNDDPVLASIGSLSAYEYEPFNYTVNATDVDDGDSLTFATDSNFFSIHRQTGVLSFTPISTYRGTHYINFSVNDGEGGIDYENVTFNILYCGDNTCSADYESCSSCEVDCGICNDQDSAGFIISRRNCYGEEVQIKAVTLVTRSTCEVQGEIINGLEVCGNKTSTTVIVEKEVDGTYAEVFSLLTDDVGEASYRANETGKFRLSYQSTTYSGNEMYFSVKKCTDDEIEQVRLEQNKTKTEAIKLPSLEEPKSPTERVSSSVARVVYLYILIPLLFVLIAVAGGSIYYGYEKGHGGNVLTKMVDTWTKRFRKKEFEMEQQIENSKWYHKLIPLLNLVVYPYRYIKNGIYKLIEPLYTKKTIKVPYYAIEVAKNQEQQLLLLSLLTYQYGHKHFETFLEAVTRERHDPVTNLRGFAILATTMALKSSYHFSKTKSKEELVELYNRGVSVEKSYPTLSDMKSRVLRGEAIVLPLHMKTLNDKAPDQVFIAIICGYTKGGFKILDYSFSKSDRTIIPYSLLKKSWEATGYSEVMVVGK